MTLFKVTRTRFIENLKKKAKSFKPFVMHKNKIIQIYQVYYDAIRGRVNHSNFSKSHQHWESWRLYKHTQPTGRAFRGLPTHNWILN